MTDTGWEAWPRVASAAADALMGLQQELAAAERLSPGDLRQRECEALGNLLSHAMREVPHYRESLSRCGVDPGTPLSEEVWACVPILRRDDVRDLGERLHARSYPSALGPFSTVSSGGSTGVPVRVRKSAFEGQLWEAMCLREEAWHREDIGGRLANLRGVSSDDWTVFARRPDVTRLMGGLVLGSWGAPHDRLWKTGPMGLLQPGQPVPLQVEFIEAFAPDYLLLRPSSLRLLLSEYRMRGLRRRLKAVWTMSEAVDEDLRQGCADVFGCRVISNYTAGETGYIALQCPAGTGYHALSSVVRVEVLDGAGRPVPAGGRGRIVVTPLYSYAMPLIRYELGDEAIAGGPCGCGRGLPHLAAISGRLSNYFLLRDGTKLRVDLSHYRLSSIARIREFQLAQTGFDEVELRLVVSEPLSAEEQALVARVTKEIARRFNLRVLYPASLGRTPAGKLLQFVREFGGP